MFDNIAESPASTAKAVALNSVVVERKIGRKIRIEITTDPRFSELLNSDVIWEMIKMFEKARGADVVTGNGVRAGFIEKLPTH